MDNRSWILRKTYKLLSKQGSIIIISQLYTKKTMRVMIKTLTD